MKGTAWVWGVVAVVGVFACSSSSSGGGSGGDGGSSDGGATSEGGANDAASETGGGDGGSPTGWYCDPTSNGGCLCTKQPNSHDTTFSCPAGTSTCCGLSSNGGECDCLANLSASDGNCTASLASDGETKVTTCPPP